MNYIFRFVKSNKNLFLTYIFKIISLALRLVLSLIIVRILTDSDFNGYLRITTFSGFALTLLSILFQNLIFDSDGKKINMRVILKFNISIFFLTLIISFFITNNLYQSSFVLVYLFTPIVYCFSIIAAFDNKPVLSSFFENLFQNIILLIFISFTYYFTTHTKPVNISLNLLIFEIFISWLIVLFFCIYLFRNNIIYIKTNNNFSLKFNYIYLNTVLIYLLTKLDIIILFSTFKNDSIVKEYYTIQKISEIVQLGSDVVWLIYISKINKVKYNNKLLRILIRKVNKLNLIFLSLIAIILIITFYILNSYNLISHIDNFSLIFLFLFLYVYSGYMNVYFLLLQITRNTKFITKTLLFSCVILFIEYFLFYNRLAPINLIIILVSTYIIISKYLFFHFSKNKLF